MPPKKQVTGKEMCPECQGSGTIAWGESMLKCAACNGSGKKKAGGGSKKSSA